MKLTAQEEYGLRCLLHMARCGTRESLSIPEISRAEGLSVPNVAKLMRLLRISGFVTSARGQSGGYTLARPADQISVGSVLEALGGRLFGDHYCNRHSGVEPVCSHNHDCAVRGMWTTVQALIEKILKGTSLNDLLRSELEMTTWLTGKVNGLFPLEPPGPVNNRADVT
jgi:Rrf2 family protein